MKYKITNTDLQLDNKLHPENSEVELTKEQTKGIEDYLIPINTKSHPELVSGSTTVSNSSPKKNKRTTKGVKK